MVTKFSGGTWNWIKIGFPNFRHDRPVNTRVITEKPWGGVRWTPPIHARVKAHSWSFACVDAISGWLSPSNIDLMHCITDVMRCTAFFVCQVICDCRFFQVPVSIEGTSVNLMIVGDPAYPLMTWLMKPYPYHVAPTGSNLAERESFNVYLSSGRMLIEGAFGRLKGRWRKLLKRNEMHHGQAKRLVAACCILHNLCEAQEEQFFDAWLPDSEHELAFPQPPLVPFSGRANSASANQMRDAICAHLARNYPLRTSQLRPWKARDKLCLGCTTYYWACWA